MLLVKTKIAPSSIHGIGLFADQFIAKGTIIWRKHPDLDLQLNKELVYQLPVLARQSLLHHTYFSKNQEKYILSFDNDRFINHSSTPNVGEGEEICDGELVSIAIRDIFSNEEMTCDYTEIEREWFTKKDWGT